MMRSVECVTLSVTASIHNFVEYKGDDDDDEWKKNRKRNNQG